MFIYSAVWIEFNLQCCPPHQTGPLCIKSPSVQSEVPLAKVAPRETSGSKVDLARFVAERGVACADVAAKRLMNVRLMVSEL